jgi:glycosyltransferase involved in cell wall biosynthesis
MPKVSVIVCTYNREIYLPRTLQHLDQQDVNDFEVLIIDNNSTDHTATIAKEFTDKKPELFKYFLELDQGHTYARNRGIREAKGEILTFIDDDAFVHASYVRNIIKYFEDYSITALGGRIIPIYESGKNPEWMTKHLLPLVSALDMGLNARFFKGTKFPIGANMSFRREVFDEYGLFDVKLGRRGSSGLEGGDEKEVFIRLKKNNEPILYAPDVVVDHIIPDKRLTEEYIRGLGIGVGTSERKRLQSEGFKGWIGKLGSEAIKAAGTFVLATLNLLSGKYKAARMLIKFRIWVLKGLLHG